MGLPKSNSLVYSASTPNARIIAQGVLNRQWATQEEFKEWLREKREKIQKIIVEKGYRNLMQDGDGVWRVGVIPFLLEEDLLSRME